MPLRHKYGYNCQVGTWGNFNQLMPLGYVEVVPGETVKGTVSCLFRSQPAVLAIDTRAYVDVYAFYIPHRLTWTSFPQWITGQLSGNFFAAGGTVITNVFEKNFEPRFTTTNATNYNCNLPWLRGAIGLVWNKFFRRNDAAELSLPNAPATISSYPVSMRPSTLETKQLLGSGQTVNTQIALGGTSPNQTVDVNLLRSGLASDNFNRMRAWYGNRYVDYLAALGVQVNWSLLEEPELIGKCSHDLRFQRIAQATPTATGAPNNVVGQMAGQFVTSVKCKVGPTFIPEHGLIALYAACRADVLFEKPPVPPVLCKANRESYWSPEFEAIVGSAGTAANAAWAGALTDMVFIDQGAVAPTYNWKQMQYEEYRCGLNTNVAPAGITPPNYNMLSTVALDSTTTPDKYIKIADGSFSGWKSQPSTESFQCIAQYRLTRFSPVRHVDRRIALH